MIACPRAWLTPIHSLRALLAQRAKMPSLTRSTPSLGGTSRRTSAEPAWTPPLSTTELGRYHPEDAAAPDESAQSRMSGSRDGSWPITSEQADSAVTDATVANPCESESGGVAPSCLDGRHRVWLSRGQLCRLGLTLLNLLDEPTMDPCFATKHTVWKHRAWVETEWRYGNTTRSIVICPDIEHIFLLRWDRTVAGTIATYTEIPITHDSNTPTHHTHHILWFCTTRDCYFLC